MKMKKNIMKIFKKDLCKISVHKMKNFLQILDLLLHTEILEFPLLGINSNLKLIPSILILMHKENEISVSQVKKMQQLEVVFALIASLILITLLIC